MQQRLALFVATVGYAGFFPIAPGTVGSAVGIAIYAAIRWTDSAVVEGAALILAMVIGVWAADLVEKQLGKDPSAVVIDEVLGMLVTVAFLNVTVNGAIAAFFLFRLYDVVKPWPAGRLEHLHGGPGIMLDDAMAGVYGNLTMRLLIAIFPGTLA
ncbi:MAG TPA: phosphatidylglycerophosphatase A [Vicinamibacterales bacterium]|nr:phosphatidylglycerophosphatase A [Vicinamibacterales bacterium]